MEDDLDDLLDELESGFLTVNHNSVPSTCSGSEVVASSKASSKASRVSSGGTDELDRALRDICSASELSTAVVGEVGSASQLPAAARRRHSCREEERFHTASTTRPSSDTSSKKRAQKCHPLLLGGSRISMGHSTNTSQRACDRLRCTACDFRVIYFEGCVWHSRSDYLFFRNCYPDFGRLKKNLVKKKDHRAYACQCQWESIHGVVEVSNVTKLRWVCGKHNLPTPTP